MITRVNRPIHPRKEGVRFSEPQINPGETCGRDINLRGDRVILGGQAVTVMTGELLG